MLFVLTGIVFSYFFKLHYKVSIAVQNKTGEAQSLFIHDIAFHIAVTLLTAQLNVFNMTRSHT